MGCTRRAWPSSKTRAHRPWHVEGAESPQSFAARLSAASTRLKPLFWRSTEARARVGHCGPAKFSFGGSDREGAARRFLVIWRDVLGVTSSTRNVLDPCTRRSCSWPRISRRTSPIGRRACRPSRKRGRAHTTFGLASSGGRRLSLPGKLVRPFERCTRAFRLDRWRVPCFLTNGAVQTTVLLKTVWSLEPRPRVGATTFWLRSPTTRTCRPRSKSSSVEIRNCRYGDGYQVRTERLDPEVVLARMRPSSSATVATV